MSARTGLGGLGAPVRRRRPSAIWVETAVFMALVPLVGLVVHRDDPLFVRGPFPWALLVPVLVALRYGFAPGFVAAAGSVFLMVAAWRQLLPLRFPLQRFPAELAVGTILVTMLAGEFCDAWTRRLAALERAEAHGRRRFEGFARAYQVLRLSHEELEARASSRTASLREGLRAVREMGELVDLAWRGPDLRGPDLAQTGGSDPDPEHEHQHELRYGYAHGHDGDRLPGRDDHDNRPPRADGQGTKDPAPARPLARAILELFVNHAEVRLASVFLRDGRSDDGAPPVLGRPLAAFGEEVAASDPLVVEAWRQREAVGFDSLAGAARAAVGIGMGPGERDEGGMAPGDAAASGGPRGPGGGIGPRTGLLLAIPLVDVDGGLWGLVAIRDVPFAAYSPAHRQRMVVLGGHVADLLAFGRAADGTREASRRTFTRELRRAVHDQRVYGIDAAMVRLQVTAGAQDVVSRIVIQGRRATDRVLRTGRRDGGAVMNVLLPFTDEDGIARYLDRIEQQLRHRTGASLSDSGVEVLSRSTLHEEATRRAIAELTSDLDSAGRAAGHPA
jgi:PelD GGDEF domain